MSESAYIHGTSTEEQQRLLKLNELTNPEFLRFLELRDGDRVLEVGSGLGLLTAEVARAVPNGWVVGVELSAEQLQRRPRDVPNLRFVQGNAQALPRELGEFDLVYCRYLLEHVADPIVVLGEMRRVLKPGGRLKVQENDISLIRHDPPTPMFDRVWRAFAEQQQQLGGDPYIGRRLLRLLTAAGFNKIELGITPEVHHFGTPHFAEWLENLVGNVQGVAARLIAADRASSAEIEAAIAELRSLAQNPVGSATFYWDRAAARR